MGGENASLTPEESITGMLEVLDAANEQTNGKFMSHDGSELPW